MPMIGVWRPSTQATRRLRDEQNRQPKGLVPRPSGAGSGGGDRNKVLAIIHNELGQLQFDGDVRIVRYRPALD